MEMAVEVPDELVALAEGRVAPSSQWIGHRHVASVADMAEVRAVSVVAFGRAFRITTVIDSYEPDVCEQVYERERLLYGSYPGLEAEFRVLTDEHATQLRALATTECDFHWVRA